MSPKDPVSNDQSDATAPEQREAGAEETPSVPSSNHGDSGSEDGGSSLGPSDSRKPTQTADDDFDPNEFITFAPDASAFLDLVESGIEESASSVISPALDELKGPILNVHSNGAFEGFELGGFTPEDGEYACKIALNEFRRIIFYLEAVFFQGPQRETIKFTLFEQALRIQANALGCFLEAHFALQNRPIGRQDRPVSFLIYWRDLETAAKAVDADLTVTYLPKLQRAMLQSDNFTRPLIAELVDKFDELSPKRIGSVLPEDPKMVALNHLRAAIRYVGPAVGDGGHTRPWTGIMELRDGILMAGDMQRLMIASGMAPDGINLRLRRPYIGPFASMLDVLDHSAQVFETPSHYIFRDSSTAFGVEKAGAHFPDIAPIIRSNGEFELKRFVFPRVTFTSVMTDLCAILQGSELRARFHFAKARNGSRCTFSATNEKGKKITLSMNSEWHGTTIDHPLEGVLAPQSFLDAASCRSTNVFLDLYLKDGKPSHFRIEDEEDGLRFLSVIGTNDGKNRTRTSQVSGDSDESFV